jgi:hypothetical protein
LADRIGEAAGAVEGDGVVEQELGRVVALKRRTVGIVTAGAR